MIIIKDYFAKPNEKSHLITLIKAWIEKNGLKNFGYTYCFYRIKIPT